MLDTARLLTSQPLPPGRRVGDRRQRRRVARHRRRRRASRRGSSWPSWPPATQDGAVRAGRPPGRRARRRRPRSEGRSGDDVERAVASLVVDPGVDSVLVLYAPSLGATASRGGGGARGRRARPAPRCRSWRASTVRSRPPPARARCPCSTPWTRRRAPWAGSPPTPAGSRRTRGRGRAAVRGVGGAAARSLVQDHLRGRRRARRSTSRSAMAVLDAIGLVTLPTEVVRTSTRPCGRRRRWATPWC